MYYFKKVLSVIFLVTTVFLLASCNKAQMPKVRGKEIKLSSAEFSKKMLEIDFLLPHQDVLNETIIFGTFERTGMFSDKTDYYQKTIYNPSTEEKWLTGDYDFTEDKGKRSAKLVGYENKSDTYFNLKANKNNGKFEVDPHFLEYEYYLNPNDKFTNGKYKLEKSDFYFNSLGHVTERLNIVENSGSSPYRQVTVEELADLYNAGYDKLKFYEKDDYFSIELKIDLKDLNGTYKDALRRHFGSEYIVKANYHFVLVFKDNKIVEYGYARDYAVSYDNGTIHDKTTFIYKEINKMPAKYNTNNHKLIEDARDIKS